MGWLCGEHVWTGVLTLCRLRAPTKPPRRNATPWQTLYPQAPPTTVRPGFDTLQVLREGKLPPRSGKLEPRLELEVLTYVRSGTLAYEDSRGRSGLIMAGEFQRMTTGAGVRYGEANASASEWAHVFQVWLRPASTGLEPGHEQKRFGTGVRRGRLCLVASPEGAEGSLNVYQDARLYSGILEAGQHIVHGLGAGRCAWLQLVEGAASFADLSLVTGDGVEICDEPSVSITASTDTEVLLLDLGAGAAAAQVLAAEGRSASA